MHGGGHERGMRSGTLATHQIVGMGEAARICTEEMDEEAVATARLCASASGMASRISRKCTSTAIWTQRLPGAMNVSIAFVEGESLIMSLKDLAVSSGSACTSASLEPSYVLRALGLNDELAHSSLRFSFGRFTTEEDVDLAVRRFAQRGWQIEGAFAPVGHVQDGIDLNTIEWAAH